MLPIALSLLAAVGYGLSDFVGGLAAKRLPAQVVAMVATLGAATVVTMAAALTPATTIDGPAIAWGLASGIGGAFGGMVLYRGLARGRMAVVAPISALGAAVLPILVGVAIGDRPSMLAWGGVALALPAIWLVSGGGGSSQPVADGDAASTAATTDAPRLDPDVRDGLLAGAGFALLFIGLDLAGEAAGLWPAVVGQVAAVLVLAALSLAAMRAMARPAHVARPLASAYVAGALGGAATSAYTLATQAGLLSIVAVVTSLYPAVTIVLATTVLREAIDRRHLVGLAAAGVAVALIVAG